VLVAFPALPPCRYLCSSLVDLPLVERSGIAVRTLFCLPGYLQTLRTLPFALPTTFDLYLRGHAILPLGMRPVVHATSLDSHCLCTELYAAHCVRICGLLPGGDCYGLRRTTPARRWPLPLRTSLLGLRRCGKRPPPAGSPHHYRLPTPLPRCPAQTCPLYHGSCSPLVATFSFLGIQAEDFAGTLLLQKTTLHLPCFYYLSQTSYPAPSTFSCLTGAMLYSDLPLPKQTCLSLCRLNLPTLCHWWRTLYLLPALFSHACMPSGHLILVPYLCFC